jgi:hypothetical protein
MITPNSDHPFPDNPRLGQIMTGVCCELIDSKKDISQYIIIRPTPYLTEGVIDLIEKGIYTFEEYYESEIELLGHIPDPNTSWLYKLESFKVERKFHCCSQMFNDNCKDIEFFVFDDYNILMEFCKKKYGVTIKDFKNEMDTNMPMY